jgi:hypothetical protein
MPINFITNDPAAKDAMPMRQQAARKDRPAGRAGFNFEAHAPQKLYDFGTNDFLFWQSREAALAAVEAWEGFAGNLTNWADRSDKPRRIDVSPTYDGGFVGPQRLNAIYDGTGVRFFDFKVGDEVIYSGASTDTVSHEVGHALLDAIRPELFQSTLPEVNAFHESFADCNAILTALADQATRVALLQISPDLSLPNFVEATSEYLAEAIRKQFGDVAPSQPRRALNDYKWQLPSTLPDGTFRDPPALLTREIHSFSRVFTGCFYDLLRSLFTSSPIRDEAGLSATAIKVGKLLVASAQATPENARHYQAIGRTMVKMDAKQNGGANGDRIGAAFAGHGIMLGSSAMTAPSAALAGPVPRIIKGTVTLATETSADLRERIQAKKGSKFDVRPMDMIGAGIAGVTSRREVPLDEIDERLEGVVAYGAETMMVGASGTRAALLGALPQQTRTTDEVISFVESLVQNNGIDFGKKTTRAAAVEEQETRSDAVVAQPYTHIIRTARGKKVLIRVRFL